MRRLKHYRQRVVRVEGETCYLPGCGRPVGWPHSVLCPLDPGNVSPGRTRTYHEAERLRFFRHGPR